MARFRAEKGAYVRLVVAGVFRSTLGLAFGTFVAACSANSGGSTFDPAGATTGSGGATSGGATSTGATVSGTSSATNSTTSIIHVTEPDGGFGGAGGTGSSDAGMIIGTLPPDFTPTESGGYKLGQAIMGAGVTDTGLGQGACNEIVGVVRDVMGYNATNGHPDFERFSGGGTKGLVAATLGPDQKPVYTGACEAPNSPRTTCPDGQMTTGKATFDQWYRFADGVNKPHLVYFFFQATPGQSIITFDSQHFFPLDNGGWQAPGVTGGDMPVNGDDGKLHNFSFTTELHTKFKYLGGETFTFEGDDDLWVFMNNQLAIDLGGLHAALRGSVVLDDAAATLGISKGNTYPLALFHAERHTTASHFRVETTLSLVDCGSVPPDVPR